jgi:hypothetical protein
MEYFILKKQTTAKEILMESLRSKGYDGLCNIDCGCLIGDDFEWCENINLSTCIPGYKVNVKCKVCYRNETCITEVDEHGAIGINYCLIPDKKQAIKMGWRSEK